ncbi:uncharacterized protein LOC143735403 isoform X1 [Siphateles boraxobius]|uniref:uncharacterized protein LOC143735403 isoform X1 n=1 Tax=Siphateles boraxobius TaxID=180520 RepID=UPI004063920C
MTSTSNPVLFVLLLSGVFGVEADEVKTETVMEGESVILNTDLTEIQEFHEILWRFGKSGSVIAVTDGTEISYPHHTEIFSGRLQIDHQTGSLTIKNMRIKHSGLYKLHISSNSGTSSISFSVTVYESPTDAVIDAGEAEMKTVSVMEGDFFILQTDVNETHGDELIVWRFDRKLITKCDIEAKSLMNDTDERFRDRLQLDHQTGSLNVTNTRTADSGVYTVKISSSKQTLYNKFSVTVSVLSSGAVAGIVIVVLLLVFSAAAASFYYRHIICSPKPLLDADKTVSVKEGESVTLRTDAEIQNDDQIQWMFGPQKNLIAEIRGETRENSTYHGAAGRFRDRLSLDEKTGSLIITNITAEHIGVYELQTSSSRGTSYQRFIVTVKNADKTLSVKEGESVTLRTDAEIQNDDHIQWMFGPQKNLIAEIRGETRENSTYHGADGRFRDRLRLDEKTGSLIITNITAEHIGVYKLQTIRNRGTLYQRFIVTVKNEDTTVSVKEGESVTLRTDAEIQNDDHIQWMFGPQKNRIAEIRGRSRESSTYHGADGRFRDRLRLDEKTGSLIITNITAEHIGVYELQTIRNRGTLYQRFIVTVKITLISLVEGEPVTLYPDTEIQKDDVILWMFGDEDTLIAQMTEKYIFGRKTREATDGRFGDQLKLDKRTGSLTIKSTRTEHSGLYKLQITRSNRGTINERFKVAINLKKVSAKEGESVTLKTNAVIQRKDELLWLFGDENTPIAEIKGGIGKISTFGVADSRFRDRLQLDEKTGSLIITNITTEHAGVYTLKIISSKLTKIERYNVTVRVLKTIGMRGKNVTLNPDTEVQRDDLILWMFGDQDNLIAQLTGETGETTYDADERFRDKLKLNKNTGSLSISDITSGPYNLQIISSKRTSYRKFRVFKSCESGPKTVPVMAGECLVLITDFKERHEKVEWKFENKILTTGMNGDISKTFYSDDVRFRGRLELHHQTGSLTIKDTRTSDTGVYHLNLCSRGGKNIIWECSVTVSDSR